MVDFFSNLNSKIVQPILANVADKAGELQDNGEVDLPVLQNIAGQLGISEEKYEKIKDLNDLVIKKELISLKGALIVAQRIEPGFYKTLFKRVCTLIKNNSLREA